MVTALDVASYIQHRHPSIVFDNVRMQKLVYFSNAWIVGWTGLPLVTDEFEAWKNGPVARDLWTQQRYRKIPEYHGQLSRESIELIEAVVDHYLPYPVSKLIDASHEVAWERARESERVSRGSDPAAKLSAIDIASLYSNKAANGEGPVPPHHEVAHADRDAVDRARDEVIVEWRTALDLLADR